LRLLGAVVGPRLVLWKIVLSVSGQLVGRSVGRYHGFDPGLRDHLGGGSDGGHALYLDNLERDTLDGSGTDLPANQRGFSLDHTDCHIREVLAGIRRAHGPRRSTRRRCSAMICGISVQHAVLSVDDRQGL
jgi:hypothetical protein